jgi:hypothetical protein
VGVGVGVGVDMDAAKRKVYNCKDVDVMHIYIYFNH